MEAQWVAWCPCCRDYETSERHLKRCALHDAKQQIDDLLSLGGRLALDLECLLLSCQDAAAVTRWWNESHESLAAWQNHLREARHGGVLANRLANRPETSGSPMRAQSIPSPVDSPPTINP